MNFRTETLPSYEDIISGNFSKPRNRQICNNTNEEVKEVLNTNEQEVLGSFKYVKKISQDLLSKDEEGIFSEEEEGEILSSEDINISKSKSKNKKQAPKMKKIQKPETKIHQKKSRDFKSNITSSPQSTSTFVPRLVCRYFMEGVCSKGDKCTFSHSVVPNKTPEEARVKDPCKFFIMGSCMKGESCYFSHDLSVVPCKFFHLRGECATVSKGSQCRFSHDPIDKETLDKLKQSEVERIIKENSKSSISFIDDLSTKNEDSQTCKETEASTNGPHQINEDFDTTELLNPFAGDNDDDYEDY